MGPNQRNFDSPAVKLRELRDRLAAGPMSRGSLMWRVSDRRIRPFLGLLDKSAWSRAVKGEVSRDELLKIVDAAAHLADTGWVTASQWQPPHRPSLEEMRGVLTHTGVCPVCVRADGRVEMRGTGRDRHGVLPPEATSPPRGPRGRTIDDWDF